MLGLADITRWLTARTDVGDGAAAGGVNGDRERFLGVFNRRGAQGGRLCLGGAACTSMRQKAVTLLVHWTKSEALAEQKAWELHALFQALEGEEMGSTFVFCVRVGEPVPVGRDARGVREYVLELEFYYREE